MCLGAKCKRMAGLHALHHEADFNSFCCQRSHANLFMLLQLNSLFLVRNNILSSQSIYFIFIGSDFSLETYMHHAFSDSPACAKVASRQGDAARVCLVSAMDCPSTQEAPCFEPWDNDYRRQ